MNKLFAKNIVTEYSWTASAPIKCTFLEIRTTKNAPFTAIKFRDLEPQDRNVKQFYLILNLYNNNNSQLQ